MFVRLWRALRGRGEARGAPMARVPGGRVRMPGGRRRRVGAFELDVRPVTNADWQAFIEATGAARPAWMWRPGFGELEQPVVGVTLAAARAYARWAGKRLPTEAEWTRAARGVEATYPWGEAEPTAAHAHFGRGAKGAPAPVMDGERPAGRGPYGHADLVGNVWEWCAEGVLCGGFWGSVRPTACDRLTEPPDRVSGGIGFRCAR